MKNIGLKVNKNNNLYDAILYYLDNEKIDYELIEDNYDYNTIIFVGHSNEKIEINNSSSVIVISDKKEIIKDNKYIVNYIITNLVNDDTEYTEVQKEYLFKKGIYNVFIQKLAELIENKNNYNSLIYDLTEMKVEPYNWIFKFESINDTYAWLSRMNRTTSHNFVQKNISFYSEKVYDDSVREINYLTEQIINIKDNKVEVIGQDNQYEYYHNNKINYLSKSDFFISDKYFDNEQIEDKDLNFTDIKKEGNYLYYLDKDKFYKVLETNKKKPILLFELADIKEWKIVNDTLLIVSKDSLYVYSDNKGLSKIITYNELNYNYKNIYNIWKK